MASPADAPSCGPLPTRVGVAAPSRRSRSVWSPSARPVPSGVPCSPPCSGSTRSCSRAGGQLVGGAERQGPHPGGVRARLPPAPLVRADRDAHGPALARPPRRVELSVPEPLLRHFTLIDVPDTAMLGVAGTRLLLEAAGRAGALLFVIAADQAFTAAELNLLAEVAPTSVEVVFAVTRARRVGSAC
ncbi:hypothetical protein NKG94_27745 [Micromonospora sp. M12]